MLALILAWTAPSFAADHEQWSARLEWVVPAHIVVIALVEDEVWTVTPASLRPEAPEVELFDDDGLLRPARRALDRWSITDGAHLGTAWDDVGIAEAAAGSGLVFVGWRDARRLDQVGSPLATRQEDGTWSIVVQPAWREGARAPAGKGRFYVERLPVPARKLTWDPAERSFSEEALADDPLQASAIDPASGAVAFATASAVGRMDADGTRATRRTRTSAQSVDIEGDTVAWCDGERVWWWHGASLRRVRLPGAFVVDLDGDTVVIGTPGGIYAWDPGDPPAVLASGAVNALAAEDGRVAFLDAGGTLRLLAR
jgi:hypothetical protein